MKNANKKEDITRDKWSKRKEKDRDKHKHACFATMLNVAIIFPR